MVDVVVDQKPIERPPYDPNDIPEAVRKRVQAVEALYGSAGEQQPPAGAPEPPQSVHNGEPPAPQVPAPLSVSPPTTVTPAPADPSPPDDDNSNTWKSRALSKEGRERKELEQANKDLGELQARYYEEVARTQAEQRPRRRATPQPRPTAHLTEKDEQNYGPELLDLAQRAALQAVEPKLQTLEQQNVELRRQQQRDQRRILDQQVELAVPDFRDVDRNPRWHRWLLGVDVLSGRVRQTLLNEAISAGAAPRVISFFKGFKQEEAATGHIETAPTSQQAYAPREPAIPLASLASPGRARPATGGESSLPLDKPYYTRAQIAQLYSLRRRGAYLGREAEWARQDADIIAAANEGRIRT